MSADDLGFDEAIQINIGDEEEEGVAVGVGDVNGDGVDDILFGPSEDLQGAENPAILFGSNQFGGSNDAPVAQNDDLTLRSSTIVDLTSDNGFGVDLDPDQMRLFQDD